MRAFAGRRSWRAGVAAGAVWGAAWIEVLIRERYHALFAQLDNMAWLAALAIVAIVDAIAGRWLPAAWRRSFAGRYLVLALALWFWIVIFGGASGPRFVAAVTISTALWLAVGLAAAALPPAWADRVTGRLPAALGLGALLFVLFPMAMVAWTAKPVNWPVHAAAPDTPGLQASPKDVLVLLFDELNEQAAGPIVAALQQEGLHVHLRPLTPVGDATAKVIPAMWLHRPFGEAKPCSVSAICSGTDILDFARVKVNAPGVDVVGFYHPYCQMHGLRWCRRESPLGLLDASGRWVCAVRRRLNLSVLERCNLEQHVSWTVLVQRVEQSYWQAPFWREGGLLYAHLPFPHPPASDPRQTLVEQYASGIQHAARLTAESVRRLREAGRTSFTVMVTSDHPLRVAGWCSNGTYSARRCKGQEALIDRNVPLIFATTGPAPSLASIRGNEQVFDLVALPR